MLGFSAQRRPDIKLWPRKNIIYSIFHNWCHHICRMDDV